MVSTQLGGTTIETNARASLIRREVDKADIVRTTVIRKKRGLDHLTKYQLVGFHHNIQSVCWTW
jgi:hypothetical protein